MTSRPRTTSPSRKISLRRKKQKTDDRISGRPFFCLGGKGELCHLSVTADAVPPPLQGRQRGAKAPLEGSCRRCRLRGVSAPSKRRSPSAGAERLFSYDREFQGIWKYQPYRFPAVLCKPDRLPRSAVPPHIADCQHYIRMLHHITVPVPQAVLRIVCLQHRLLIAVPCDGKSNDSAGLPATALPAVHREWHIPA